MPLKPPMLSQHALTGTSFLGTGGTALVGDSTLYREFLAEREEILRHKWLLSEKCGQDVGFDRALLDWCHHHRSAWRRTRRRAA